MGVENFVVTFTQPTLFKDVAGNPFRQPYVIAAAKRLSYMPASEKETVAAAGTTLSTASLITLGVVIGIVALQYAQPIIHS